MLKNTSEHTFQHGSEAYCMSCAFQSSAGRGKVCLVFEDTTASGTYRGCLTSNTKQTSL